MKCENEGSTPSFSHFFLIPLFFRSPTIEALSITTKIPLACNLVLAPSQFMTIIYSVDYKDAGKDTGKDTGKDAVTVNKPDIYVLKLIKVVEDKTVTVKDMMAMLKLKGADNFRKKYLNPAIKDGYMTLLYPDSVTNKGQAYYLTEKGLKLLAEL